MKTFCRILMIIDALLLVGNLYVKNYWLAVLLGFAMGMAAWAWRETDD